MASSTCGSRTGVTGTALSEQIKTYSCRIIWLLLIIGGVTLMIVQIHKKFESWKEAPINTKISIEYPPQLPFPMVTICNTNQFK